MAASLDIVNQTFANELSKGPPLYEKTPVEARQILESVQQHTPAPDITQEELDVPYESYNVKTIIFRPKSANGHLSTIFYTHGGGWILGSPTVHGSLMEDLARQTGAAIVFPYYTPAPEKQYPTQFEESFAVLKYIVENGEKYHLKTETLALAGDSVGGHMAIAMVQLIHTRNLPVKLCQLILFYPVTDTAEKSETYKIYKDGPYLTEKTMDWMISAFLPNEEQRCNALTSPLKYATDEELSRFPSTAVFLSGADPLIGEGRAFGLRLQAAGVETAILTADGQIHDYVMLEPIRGTETAKAVIKLASLYLKNGLGL
ncbi:uncharacterized protein N7511_000211 [Penicillium nucicola]|uniref:uncharacterized protein n=1 Tax=Penicillium nucicola TaxID=1850975 RepID=UPI002545115E|nr:uncharacterized protein N7511_000211 [Penicillium nucicola]KAJ5775200.1 hypothetical protein N7511_000211 [Penicillium nucicola]